MNRIRSLAVGACLGACAGAAFADAVGAVFDVKITLNAGASTSICTNQASTDALGVTVRVVCNTPQFVSIEPVANPPFMGTIGSLGRVSLISAPSLIPQPPVTALPLPATNRSIMSGSGSSLDLRPGGLQAVVEIGYEERGTGNPVAPPQQGAETESVSAYKNLYAGTGSETTQRFDTSDNAGKTPIEMLINY
jgi:hypothetical protein